MGDVIEKPFGNVRLQIVKLISSLLSMHNEQINERFAQLDTIKLLLVSINQNLVIRNLYFKFLRLVLTCKRVMLMFSYKKSVYFKFPRLVLISKKVIY